MGASNFTTDGKGKTIKDAFRSAKSSAEWEYGHGGYSGSLAEKDSYVLITDAPESLAKRLRAATENDTPDRYLDKTLAVLMQQPPTTRDRLVDAMIDALYRMWDDRINDKWGPAGAIMVEEGYWRFFGMAST